MKTQNNMTSLISQAEWWVKKTEVKKKHHTCDVVSNKRYYHLWGASSYEKNKYGLFDWFNFYKRHDVTFNTDQRLYQPQLGTWGAQTLTYSKFQTRQQRYIVDATEVLSCNTDYLEEGYNELFKHNQSSGWNSVWW